MTNRAVPEPRPTAQPVTDLSVYDGMTADGTKVDDGECLYCYLLRMVEAFGCRDGHRFTRRWIDSQPRRHGWVIGWVEKGGGFCDCEVIFNAFRDDRNSERHRRLRCAASYIDEDDDVDDDPDDPDDADDDLDDVVW